MVSSILGSTGTVKIQTRERGEMWMVDGKFLGRPAARLPGLVADGYDEILLRKFPIAAGDQL